MLRVKDEVMKRINTSILVCFLLVANGTFAQPIAVKGSIPLDATGAVVPTMPVVIEGSETPENAGLVDYEEEPKFDALKVKDTPKYDHLRDVTKRIPEYLNLKVTYSDRVQVLPDGKVRFSVTASSLRDNVETLLSHTHAVPFFPKDFPENMRLFNEFYLYGDNVLDILDQLISPFAEQQNVHAYPHINNVVEFSFTRKD
jgi:hypothetical protein